MDTHLPLQLSEYLKAMGIRPPANTKPAEPKTLRTFEYNLPEIDENGEPPF